MDRPFRKNVTLTPAERAEFERLVKPLKGGPTASKLGRRTMVRVAIWRHRGWATLLIPIGIVIMAVAVLTWWPAGFLGALFLAIGIFAGLERFIARLVQARIGRRNKPSAAP